MKGIAIIGVVIGHAGVSLWTEAFVNQWHLATFFFVSGMCFKEKYLDTPMQYIKRRVKSLYVPFVQFGVLFLLLHNILYYIYCAGNEYSIEEMIREVFNLTVRLTSFEPLMGAMWFCPALLFTSLIMYYTQIINRTFFKIGKLQNNWRIGILPISVFMIGYTAIQLHIKSPYCIWQYMVISIIIFMGYWFKRYIQTINLKNNTYLFISISGFIFISICTSFDIMARLQPHNINNERLIALIMIPTIAGLTVYSLSYLLNQTRLKTILSYIGDHSFSIMALHFFAFKIVNLVQIFFYDYDIQRLKEFAVIAHENSWAWTIAYVMTGVSFPLLLGYIYKTIKR